MHTPAQTPAPAIICIHGLFSSQLSSKFIAVTEALASEGFIAVRFDHRGCGHSPGDIADTTVGNRLEDLRAVGAYVQEHPDVGEVFGYMGSSLGGVIALLAHHNQPVPAVAIWSTPLEILNGGKSRRVKTAAQLSAGFFTDLRQHPLTPKLAAIGNCLVIHGVNDELVPLWHGLGIYTRLGLPKQLQLLPGADHRFSNPLHRQRALDQTRQFFQLKLGNRATAGAHD